MRTHTVVAALLMVAAAMSPVAFASGPAQLHVQVLDDRHAPLAGASVTAYTLDGNPGVTVTADENGVATFESVAAGMTQIVARSAPFAPSIDKATLKAGDNTRIVSLHLESDESE
jgi:hypothetical protein